MDKNINVIDEYISSQPEEIQERLKAVRDTIKKAIPEAEEKISWRMPTYWKGYNIIHFAAFKNHIGIYPGALAIEHFQEEFKDYKSSKGAVQFPHSKPLPLELLTKIAKWAYENNRKKC